jgi:outer membrane protein OmpA-like peptidoglycan-associated protein
MNLAAPFSIAVLGKQATENKVGATGLMSLLASQKDSILSMVPSGFNLASLLGLGSLASLGTNALSGVKSVANVAEDAAEEGAGFMRWLLPLLLLGAAIAALVYFARGCGGATTVEEPVKKEEVKKEEPKKEEVKAPATTESKGSFDEKTGNYIYDIGGIFKLKLPNNGGELEVGEFSSERKLFDMLNDPNFKVDEQDKSKGWFSLDRVYFETGKSSLTAESQAQLERTAKILKAFPTAELKLGGYTDNTGAADMNKKLSGDRAKMVLDKLVALGVAATRLRSEGYGPEHPICAPNDTPACKAQNRRVDLRVTKK